MEPTPDNGREYNDDSHAAGAAHLGGLFEEIASVWEMKKRESDPAIRPLSEKASPDNSVVVATDAGKVIQTTSDTGRILTGLNSAGQTTFRLEYDSSGQPKVAEKSGNRWLTQDGLHWRKEGTNECYAGTVELRKDGALVFSGADNPSVKHIWDLGGFSSSTDRLGRIRHIGTPDQAVVFQYGSNGEVSKQTVFTNGSQTASERKNTSIRDSASNTSANDCATPILDKFLKDRNTPSQYKEFLVRAKVVSPDAINELVRDPHVPADLCVLALESGIAGLETLAFLRTQPLADSKIRSVVDKKYDESVSVLLHKDSNDQYDLKMWSNQFNSSPRVVMQLLEKLPMGEGKKIARSLLDAGVRDDNLLLLARHWNKGDVKQLVRQFTEKPECLHEWRERLAPERLLKQGIVLPQDVKDELALQLAKVVTSRHLPDFNWNAAWCLDALKIVEWQKSALPFDLMRALAGFAHVPGAMDKRSQWNSDELWDGLNAKQKEELTTTLRAVVSSGCRLASDIPADHRNQLFNEQIKVLSGLSKLREQEVRADRVVQRHFGLDLSRLDTSDQLKQILQKYSTGDLKQLACNMDMVNMLPGRLRAAVMGWDKLPDADKQALGWRSDADLVGTVPHFNKLSPSEQERQRWANAIVNPMAVLDALYAHALETSPYARLNRSLDHKVNESLDSLCPEEASKKFRLQLRVEQLQQALKKSTGEDDSICAKLTNIFDDARDEGLDSRQKHILSEIRRIKGQMHALEGASEEYGQMRQQADFAMLNAKYVDGKLSGDPYLQGKAALNMLEKYGPALESLAPEVHQFLKSSELSPLKNGFAAHLPGHGVGLPVYKIDGKSDAANYSFALGVGIQNDVNVPGIADLKQDRSDYRALLSNGLSHIDGDPICQKIMREGARLSQPLHELSLFFEGRDGYVSDSFRDRCVELAHELKQSIQQITPAELRQLDTRIALIQQALLKLQTSGGAFVVRDSAEHIKAFKAYVDSDSYKQLSVSDQRQVLKQWVPGLRQRPEETAAYKELTKRLEQYKSLRNIYTPGANIDKLCDDIIKNKAVDSTTFTNAMAKHAPEALAAAAAVALVAATWGTGSFFAGMLVNVLVPLAVREGSREALFWANKLNGSYVGIGDSNNRGAFCADWWRNIEQHGLWEKSNLELLRDFAIDTAKQHGPEVVRDCLVFLLSAGAGRAFGWGSQALKNSLTGAAQLPAETVKKWAALAREANALQLERTAGGAFMREYLKHFWVNAFGSGIQWGAESALKSGLTKEQVHALGEDGEFLFGAGITTALACVQGFKAGLKSPLLASAAPGPDRTIKFVLNKNVSAETFVEYLRKNNFRVTKNGSDWEVLPPNAKPGVKPLIMEDVTPVRAAGTGAGETKNKTQKDESNAVLRGSEARDGHDPLPDHDVDPAVRVNSRSALEAAIPKIVQSLAAVEGFPWSHLIRSKIREVRQLEMDSIKGNWQRLLIEASRGSFTDEQWANREQMRKLLHDDPFELDLYEKSPNMATELQTKWNDVQRMFEGPRAEIERLINTQLQRRELPPVKIELVTEIGSFAGAYEPGTGKIRIPVEELSNGITQDLAGLLAHELKHSEQDSLRIRKMAVDASSDGTTGEKLIEKVQALYRERMNSGLDADFARSIINQPNGKSLSPSETLRARALEDAQKTHGQMMDLYHQKESNLRSVNRAIADVSKGRVADFVAMLKGNNENFKHYFGESVPPDVQMLLKLHGRIAGGELPASAWSEPHARDLLCAALRNYREKLVQDASKLYRGTLDEQEARVAERHAIEHARKNKIPADPRAARGDLRPDVHAVSPANKAMRGMRREEGER